MRGQTQLRSFALADEGALLVYRATRLGYLDDPSANLDARLDETEKVLGALIRSLRKRR